MPITIRTMNKNLAQHMPAITAISKQLSQSKHEISAGKPAAEDNILIIAATIINDHSNQAPSQSTSLTQVMAFKKL
jgi:hypothetical protein